MQQPEDLPALTALRGFAALAVAVHHFYAALQLDPPTALIPNGWLWVDLFFALSGFVMMHVYGAAFAGGATAAGYGAFLKARLARIYPLHLFTIGLVLLLEGVMLALRLAAGDAPVPWFVEKGYLNEASDGVSLLGNLLLVQAWGIFPDLTWNQVAWSISAEFLAYLLFPPLCLALGLLGRAGRIGTGLILAVAACLFMGWADGRLDLTWQAGAVRCLLDFGGGAGLYSVLALARGRLRWLGSDAACVAITAAVLWLLHSDAPVWAVLAGFFALVPAAAANRGRFAALLATPGPQALGRWSYSVYLLHILVMLAVLSALQVAAGVHSWDELGRLPWGHAVPLLILSVTLPLAALTYRMVEVPGRRLIRGLALPRLRRANGVAAE